MTTTLTSTRRSDAAVLRRIWRLHFWIGLFAAPVLIVLAFVSFYRMGDVLTLTLSHPLWNAAGYNLEQISVADGIVAAAREIAETTEIKAICCFTSSGTTASLVARERPRVPIIAMTNRRSTARVMALTWGCYCVVTGDLERFKQAVVNAARAARASGIASEGDQIVVTAGVPFNVPGTTNILRVAPCDERLIYSTDPE